MDERGPCPFCNRPNAVKIQQQELYSHDGPGKVAILTPAGFFALDRYHDMTDKIEELNALVDRLRADLLDPPADVQELVLRKLGLWPPPPPYSAGGKHGSTD